MNTASGTDFKFEAKVPHKKSNQFSPFWIGHMTSIHLTEQNANILQTGV